MLNRSTKTACALLIALLCPACSRSSRQTLGEVRLTSAPDRLKQLQQSSGSDEDASVLGDGLRVSRASGPLRFDYYGDYNEEALEPLLNKLSRPEVARALGALSF